MEQEKCQNEPRCRNDAESPHPCPYAEEIYDDSESLCTCCNECSHECAMDV